MTHIDEITNPEDLAMDVDYVVKCPESGSVSIMNLYEDDNDNELYYLKNKQATSSCLFLVDESDDYCFTKEELLRILDTKTHSIIP